MILFLDFDGVTHPEPCHQEEAFACLKFIEDLLREFPTVQIVISSSWRDFHSIEELRANFSLDMQARVIDVTPSIRKPNEQWLPGSMAYERQWEIEAWLRINRPKGTNWLAIDDRPLWFEPECRNLLVTERKRGFHLGQVEELRQMILERLEGV